MSQFKRFNASENDNWDTGFAHPEGTLTWDPDNGLRLHDGYTSGGNQVGGSFPINQGGGALNDFLFGGAGSNDNGKVLIQNTSLAAQWGYADRVDTADNAVNLDDQASISWNDRSGMVVVTDHYHGYTYTWIAGGGSVVLLGGTNGGSAATCTLTFNGSYTLTNVSGTNRNFGVAWVVTRHST